LKTSLSFGTAEEASDLIPFHKLTGWTTYSLIEPMESILGWKFTGVESLTGLPEYRNGTVNYPTANPTFFMMIEK
jgi:Protein of unknown function (DUF1688)